MKARSSWYSDPSVAPKKNRIRKSLGIDRGFQIVEIARDQLNIDAIEAVFGAALFAVKLFHPAVQVRVLTLVVEFDRVVVGVEVDRLRGDDAGRSGIHVETHRMLLWRESGLR